MIPRLAISLLVVLAVGCQDQPVPHPTPPNPPVPLPVLSAVQKAAIAHLRDSPKALRAVADDLQAGKITPAEAGTAYAAAHHATSEALQSAIAAAPHPAQAFAEAAAAQEGVLRP